MRDKVVGQFEAVDDSGDHYTVLEIQEYVSAANFDDPHAAVPGMKRMETSDGDEVIILDGELCLRSTHHVLRKVGG